MKKKLLFLFIFVIALTFVPKVKAITCYYQGTHTVMRGIAGVTLEECKKYGKDVDCLYEEGNRQKLFVELPIPKTYEAGKMVQIYFEYLNRNGEKQTSTTSPSWLGDTENWTKRILPGKYTTTGQMYVSGQYCPSHIVLRLGVDYNNKLRFIVAQNEDEALDYVDWMLQKSGLDYLGYSWSDVSYVIVAEKYGESGGEEEIEESNYSSCMDFTSETGPNGNDGCVTNNEFSCLWVKKKASNGNNVEYCNFDSLTYVRCGDSWDLPDKLPAVVSFIANLIKIVTPIILIIVSIISLVKAVSSSKEDEIKKAQSGLIKKLISAAIVFFMIQITQFVIFKVAEKDEVDNISTCFSCLLNNDCSKNRYYKTLVGKNYQCTYLNDTSTHCECNTKGGADVCVKNGSYSDSNKSNNSSQSNNNSNGTHGGGGREIPSAEGSHGGGGREISSAEGSHSGGSTKF